MSRYTANGWQVASIYRPDTGDVVQLNELVPEYCGLEHGIITSEGTAYKLQSAKNKVLKLGSTDYDAFETLRQWAEEKRLVRAVVAGSDRNVQWYESVEIGEFMNEPKANRRDGDTKWGVVLEKIGRNPAIYNNQNLLAYLGWQDENADGGVDNYTFTGVLPATFTNSIQTVSDVKDYRAISTGLNTSSFNAIIFPLSGIRLNASVDVVNLHSINNYHFQSLKLRTFSGANLETNAVQVTATGVASRNISSTPIGLFNIVYEFAQGNGSAQSGTFAVRNPALTTNGRLTPGNKFMSW